MGLAKISLYLGTVGGLSLLIGFILAVVHTTLLAAGRRTIALPSAMTPATAGAGTSAATATITFGPSGRGTAASTGASSPSAAATLPGSIGHAFTWVVPWIGALGALITGTNTNSNLLFARMELVTARSVGLDLPTVMALQNLGAAVASVLSPAKIMVGLSTVGMAGAEGRVMRRLAWPAALIILAVSMIALL